MALVEWGNVSEALGAAGAFAAAGVAVWLAQSANRRAQRAEAELSTRQDREQASKVTAWAFNREAPQPFAQGKGWWVVAKNASDLPVFEVNVQLIHGDGAGHVVFEVWDVLPPGHEANFEASRVRKRDDGTEDRDPWPIGWRKERPYVLMQFTDASMQRWERGKGGWLTKIAPSST